MNDKPSEAPGAPGGAAAPGRTESPLVAISAMIGATVFYLVGDSTVKVAIETLPAMQIIALRGIVTVALCVAAASAAGVLVHWRRALDRRVLLRSTFDGVTTMLFVHALIGMAIADATAVINSVPIVATVLAILILKERVGVRRWIAILVGFAGVILVVRPSGSGMDFYGLLACGATVSVACREIVTRRIDHDVPALIVTLSSAAVVCLSGAAAMAVEQVWVPLDARTGMLIAGSALCLFGAYHLSVVAVRHGEISLVGPFRYLVIVWGLIVGYIVWGDVPDLAAVAGMSLIALSGLYVLSRERTLRRRTAARSAQG